MSDGRVSERHPFLMIFPGTDWPILSALRGGDLETGTWGPDEDLSCLMPEGSAKRCYAFTVPDAQGRFSGKSADGIEMTARKLE